MTKPPKSRIPLAAGVTLTRSIPHVLSDGTTLLSDHYYPPASFGPVNPTLLMRQPYGRDIASTVVYAHPAWFARHGYNVVIEDVRGRGGSGGEFYPFRHEARDGAETIAWLRTLPESSGRIGMYGFSYQGATQLLAAAERPEGLQCIAPAQTAADLYSGWFYHHGALRLASSLGWGLQMLREDARRLNLPEASALLEAAWREVRIQPQHLPYAHHPAITDPSLPSYVRDWFAHPTPGPYWSEQDISLRAGQIEVPALHLSGWFDPYLTGSIQTFDLLRNNAATPHARENQYLLAGPWTHIPWTDRAGELALGPESLLDTDTLLLRWFDHWLKDANTWTNIPPVTHFVLGPNTWQTAEDWCSDITQPFFLHSQGRADSRKGNGTLTLAEPSTPEPPDLFVYDPEVPILAPGGPQSLQGSFDQAALESGNNVLVYTSAPLGQPLQILGFPIVSLHISTSAPSADVTAKLIRVLPPSRDGSARADFICIGIARSTFLFGPESGIDYAPDTVHLWQFPLEPISCLLASGERLRLEIAASAFPLYDRNPGTLVPPAEMTYITCIRSTHILHHDPNHPSALILPILNQEDPSF